jgi:6-phosphogluconolactonase
MTPEIHISPNPQALAEEAARRFAVLAREAIGARGRCVVAISGGSTPRTLLRLLALPPYRDTLDWGRIHAAWGDERCVPPDDEKSNYRAARESLLDLISIPPENVHRIEGELAPGEAAARYTDVIATALPLDVIILGMGDDGHTASLFPGEPEPPAGALVAATKSPVAPHDRVTLTLDAIRATRSVILQVTGAGKAARLAQAYRELEAGTPTLPVTKIGPATWIVDEAAAAQIPARSAQ